MTVFLAATSDETSAGAAEPSSFASAPLPAKSSWLYRGFVRYCRWYVPRQFNAIRLAKPGFPGYPAEEPVLIYMNHPSWWDPLVGLLLAEEGFAERSHYAPIDAAALKQYAFFGKLGFFGIEPDTPTGGRKFLRMGRRIMAEPQAALWVTAEGHFTDPRQRPVRLRPGVAHLAKHLTHGHIVPLALEYPFWEEKYPEALACFGDPIAIESQTARTTKHWHAKLTEALEHTMNRLSTLAMRREPVDWLTLLSGRAGTSVTYDLWRSVRARLRGEPFHVAHREAVRHD